MFTRLAILMVMICCAPLQAGDASHKKAGTSHVYLTDPREEFATSPSYLVLTGSKPDGATKPTGKFQALADDVVRRVKAEHPDYNPQSWMTNDHGKQGVTVVYPVTYDMRIDNVTHAGCPNSLYKLSGYDTDQKWLEGSLETWMRLDHGWTDADAKMMLTSCQITDYKDSKCVEFPHTEVKQYRAKMFSKEIEQYRAKMARRSK